MPTDFRELVLKHKGKVICVLGGAPIDQVPKADIYISANAHHVDKVKPDYVLAMDETHSGKKVAMGDYLRSLTDAPIISPHGYADYSLGTWPQHPRWVLTGMIAVWAAFMMGAKAVIVAGMDGYGGENGYLDEAKKISRDVHCPVRVFGGGPLEQAWPAYDPGERFGRYKPHGSIEAWQGKDGLVRIEVKHPCTIRGKDARPGDEFTVMRHEIKRELKHKMVVEV